MYVGRARGRGHDVGRERGREGGRHERQGEKWKARRDGTAERRVGSHGCTCGRGVGTDGRGGKGRAKLAN